MSTHIYLEKLNNDGDWVELPEWDCNPNVGAKWIGRQILGNDLETVSNIEDFGDYDCETRYRVVDLGHFRRLISNQDNLGNIEKWLKMCDILENDKDVWIYISL